jgi:hypothetical protein
MLALQRKKSNYTIHAFFSVLKLIHSLDCALAMVEGA